MSIDFKNLRWLSEQTINGPQLGRKGLAECHAAIPSLLDEIEHLEKIKSLFIEIDKRIVWEAHGLGNSLAEEIETLLKNFNVRGCKT